MSVSRCAKSVIEVSVNAVMANILFQKDLSLGKQVHLLWISRFSIWGLMMQRTRLMILVFFLIAMPGMVCAQAVPEEALRHKARGLAAVEMAKSLEEYDLAIKEFQEASQLAPDWPDPHYNLGLVLERAGKFREAVASFKEYLRLAPNAPDVAKIQEQIYKLEYKAEQTLTTPEIIEALVSFSGWEAENPTDCVTRWKDLFIWRNGHDSVNVPTFTVPAEINGRKEYSAANHNAMDVTGPVLKYTTVSNICSEFVYDNNHNQWPDYCFRKVENEIKVVSKTLVKVTQNRTGNGAGVTKCTFQKK